MIEYIKNILPRLAKHSETLDNVELFVDHPWVFIDDDNNKHQYIFERNGNLIMSLNGKGTEGKWRYISTAKSLWIDRGVDKILLNQGFIDKGVMVLKKDALTPEPFILINANIIPDLDVVGYLESFLESQKPKEVEHVIENPVVSVPIVEPEYRYYFKLEDSNEIDIESDIVLSRFKEQKIIKKAFPLEDGDHKVLNQSLYLTIKNDVIVAVYYKVAGDVKKGELVIYQNQNSISYNDRCTLNGSSEVNGFFKVFSNCEHRTLRLLILKGKVKIYNDGFLMTFLVILYFIIEQIFLAAKNLIRIPYNIFTSKNKKEK